MFVKSAVIYFNVPHWRQDHPFMWFSGLYKGPAIFMEKAIYLPLLEENWTELTFKKIPGIVTWDATFNYWPNFFLSHFYSPGSLCKCELGTVFFSFLSSKCHY